MMHAYTSYHALTLIIIQQFITIDNGDVTDLSDYRIMESAGVFCWRSRNGLDYRYADNFPYTSNHELARKMSLAITIMGAICWGSYFLASCVRFHPLIWLVISLTLLATCICEGLMFKFFDTDWCEDTNCSLGKSSRCGISACVFWGISSMMTCGVFSEAYRKADEED